MASKYSQKTAISLYRFNSEDEYRKWLSANLPRSGKDDFHDIIAFVKNPLMSNGLDMFVNGHSVTKGKVYVKKLDGTVVEVTDSKMIFDDSKQYLVKNISRKGSGEKNIMVLEEVNIQKLVSDKVDNTIQSDEFNQYLDDRMEGFIDDYLDKHPVKAELYDKEKIERILTHTHYMFRKIFTLMYKERAIHLGLEMRYIDANGKMVTPYAAYKDKVSFSKIQFRVSNVVGSDVQFHAFEIYKDNDFDNPIISIQGKDIVAGWNEIRTLEQEFTETTVYHAKLYYSIHRLVNTAFVNNMQNYDEVATFKDKNEVVCCCAKFFVRHPEEEKPDTPDNPDNPDKPDDPVNPPSPTVYRKCYVAFVPTDYDEDGWTILKPPYNEIDNLETVAWFRDVAPGYSDIKILGFQIKKGASSSSYTYTIPKEVENYQPYFILPMEESGYVSVNDGKGGMDDTVTEVCDVDAMDGVEYKLFKQDFAQVGGNTFVLKFSK